jgi:EmrB/QacA subfamily drug resistance transporter
VTGLCVFTIGSALCGASPSLHLLVAARVLQGIGASCLMAVSPAMLVGAFPASERGRALGMNATVVALGITAGPTLGGVITAQASWRWIFYVNLPIGIGAVVATLVVLPPDRQHEQARFDLAGAGALASGLAALAAGLSIGNDAGWTSPTVLALATIAVAAGVLFALQERRHEAPLLDARLFQNRLFAWATASLVVSFLAAFATAFLLPIYLEQVRHFGLEQTGLLLTAFPLVVAVVAPISGHTADRIGTRTLAATGMAILVVGLLLMSRLDGDSSRIMIVASQAVSALGMGLFQSPNNSAIMGAAPKDRQGVAAGMLATGRTMGQAMSVAIAGAVFAAFGAGLRGFQAAMVACAVIAAGGIVTSLLRGRER